ncbi:putative activation/secretion signal peptide protein [Methylophaga frappieri]|uniref:Putative activation/secretion signal peptide protein n=1 Tax=Methylophaga frappieri (strain ATCC BAA-2434 / DSM 25690 / JAM7) TaxID=754477 RepID=I1YJB5_METFJ|nr:ShlB/FhaC/HecB family hemolysin secretion/activation protein [Methylophaga frappieri]AFJ03008.1 putative activation/secretion signal peptide protein [Methylophaga frappieri]
MKSYFSVIFTSAALLVSAQSYAQTPPDAGQILQQNQQDQLQPLAPSVDIELNGTPLTTPAQGGIEIALKRIVITGNTVFSSQTLLNELGDTALAPKDIAGLWQLANQISTYYRQQGYAFARAILPAQELSDGELTIQVIEGRYGEVDTTGDSALSGAVRPYLGIFESGELINTEQLERQMLIVGDLPGVDILPVMRPGNNVGEGDLLVTAQPAPRLAGYVGVDNHGNRYAGEYRMLGNVQINRLLTLGDTLSVTALYTSEDTWLGGIGYSLPLGITGVRGFIDYAHTDYTLGKGFEGYEGRAKVTTAGLSYPLIRSQQRNLVVKAAYRYKELDDEIRFADVDRGTDSHSLPVTLQFDQRDSFAGGGVTFGELSWTTGRINVDAAQEGDDDYRFNKLNLQLARQQSLASLSPALTLFTQFRGQWADRDFLDGSESFLLGGTQGVRAYPVGEGSDSKGLLAQIELRYATQLGLQPYLFYDVGRSIRGDEDGHARSISGAGFGARYGYQSVNIDASLAWPLTGGDPQSDDKDDEPRIWVSATYQF